MSSTDFEHWHIKATVYKDRVEEIHYISDPARNIRRKAQTRVWHIESFLGKGGFGEVRLERNRENGTVRAVKRITTASPNLSNSECEKELKALLEFSKPKASYSIPSVSYAILMSISPEKLESFATFMDGLETALKYF
jgi:hypothetical protein